MFPIIRNIFSRLFGRWHTAYSLSLLSEFIILFLLIFSIHLVLYKWLEGVSWEEAFWQGWQTFTTVGYGDQPARTFEGRVVTMVLSTMGIAVLAGIFSEIFEYRRLMVEKKTLGLMKNPIKDGYVIFNFPEVHQGSIFINELRTVERNVGICIVDNNLEKLPENIAILPNIHFIKGSPLNRDTYERARITDNKAVIIFPNKPSVSNSDGETKTIVDLVTMFVTGIPECKTRIVHILADPRNAWMFQDSYSTQVSERFELLAVVQELQDKYSAEIIETLLTNSRGANLRTVTPKEIVGWTWEEFVQRSIAVSRRINLLCNPLALIKDGENNACPSLDDVIEEGDCISVITFSNFKWDKFEKELVKVGEKIRRPGDNNTQYQADKSNREKSS